MSSGVRNARYLVLAREDVSSYVEGRALVKAGTESVCRFILEDIISRYGSFYQMRADRKELNAQEARDFFQKYKIKLKLTTAYNPVFILAITASSWGAWEPEKIVKALAVEEGIQSTGNVPDPDPTKGETSKRGGLDKKKTEKGKGRIYHGKEIDKQYDKGRVSSLFWSQEIRVLTVGDFFSSIRKDVQEEILEKLKRLVRNEGGVIVGVVFSATGDVQSETESRDEPEEQVEPERGHYQAYVNTVSRWQVKDSGPVKSELHQSSSQVQVSQGNKVNTMLKDMCWSRGCSVCEIEMRGISGLVSALLDSGSEVNLMSLTTYKVGGWPVDRNCGWGVNSVNDTGQALWGACARVMIRIGEVAEPINVFVHETLPYPVILGQPFITELRVETKVLDDGTHVAKLSSRDGGQGVQFPTVRPGNLRNKVVLREPSRTSESKEDF